MLPQWSWLSTTIEQHLQTKTTSPNKNNTSKQKQHLQTKTTSQKIQIQNSNNTWGYDLTVFEIFYGVEMMIAMDGRRTNKFLERQMKLWCTNVSFFTPLYGVAIFLSTPILVFCIYLLPLDVWLSIKVNAECYIIESTDITSRLWHQRVWLRLVRFISSVCAG